MRRALPSSFVRTLVPKLGLGTRLGAKLRFAWRECPGVGECDCLPADAPACEAQLRSHRHSQAKLGNERARRVVSRAAVALVALLAAAGSASAQAPRPKGFDDFALVKTRNIFDPNRRAMRSEGRDSRSMVQIVRANTLSLTGTMVTDGRTLAFFSGSRSENSKVIGVGEAVADYKVKAIAATQVELEKDGKATTLDVGKMLTLEGSTTESVVAPSAAPEAPTGDPSAPAPAAGAPASSNSKEDIVRRMMERRAKETNK